jgi:hypothetical protein
MPYICMHAHSCHVHPPKHGSPQGSTSIASARLHILNRNPQPHQLSSHYSGHSCIFCLNIIPGRAHLHSWWLACAATLNHITFLAPKLATVALRVQRVVLHRDYSCQRSPAQPMTAHLPLLYHTALSNIARLDICDMHTAAMSTN